MIDVIEYNCIAESFVIYLDEIDMNIVYSEPDTHYILLTFPYFDAVGFGMRNSILHIKILPSNHQRIL